MVICVKDRSQRQPRRGATTIEFAICAPALFLLVFASLEFSRVNMLRQSVENAVYEGCRRGIVPGATSEDVADATQVVMDAVMARSTQITVDPTVITDDTTEITVSVVLPINDNSWVSPFFFNGRTVSGSMTMRRERGATTSFN